MSDSAYAVMAAVYDHMNSGLDYGAWADFVEEQFRRYAPRRPEIVLDLACGTGSMTLELARRGYDMIRVDNSPDMLTVARSRVAEERMKKVLLLEQDMTGFELYGTVGAVVCCLDSINHLTERGALSRCFSLVRNYLDPHGLFLFDVNTPYKFKNVYGYNDFILDDPDTGTVCCWRNTYDEEHALCDFDLSFFIPRGDGTYDRADALQTERCYTEPQLRRCLKKNGFELCGIWSDYGFTPFAETDERWYVAARRMP